MNSRLNFLIKSRIHKNTSTSVNLHEVLPRSSFFSLQALHQWLCSSHTLNEENMGPVRGGKLLQREALWVHPSIHSLSHGGGFSHKLEQVRPKAGHQSVTGLIQGDKHLLHPRLRPVWLHQFTHTATGGHDSATHVLATCSQQSALHLIAYEHPPDKVCRSGLNSLNIS